MSSFIDNNYNSPMTPFCTNTTMSRPEPNYLCGSTPFQIVSELLVTSDNLWPRSGFLDGLSLQGWAAGQVVASGMYWEWPIEKNQGAKSSAGIIEGFTLDQSGSPIPFCLVEIYTVSDGVLRGTTHSDINGQYRAGVNVSGNAILTAKLGNNLLGSTCEVTPV